MSCPLLTYSDSTMAPDSGEWRNEDRLDLGHVSNSGCGAARSTALTVLRLANSDNDGVVRRCQKGSMLLMDQ